MERSEKMNETNKISKESKVLLLLFMLAIFLVIISSGYGKMESQGTPVYTEKNNYTISKKHHSSGRRGSARYYLCLSSTDNYIFKEQVQVSKDYYYSLSVGDSIEANMIIYKLDDKYASILYTRDDELFNYVTESTSDTLLNIDDIMEECAIFKKRVDKIGDIITAISISTILLIAFLDIKKRSNKNKYF